MRQVFLHLVSWLKAYHSWSKTKESFVFTQYFNKAYLKHHCIEAQDRGAPTFSLIPMQIMPFFLQL